MSLVLVADDEPAVLEVLSEVVEDLGHEVVRAHDGKEALILARAQLPHLVVTDHMMPRLSGADLCKQLRADPTLKDVPIILLSAALPHGVPEAQAFLPKPFELSEFERLVKEALSGRDAATKAGTPAAPAAEAEIQAALVAARLNFELLERSLASTLSEADRKHAEEVRRQLQILSDLAASLVRR